MKLGLSGDPWPWLGFGVPALVSADLGKHLEGVGVELVDLAVDQPFGFPFDSGRAPDRGRDGA